MYHDVIRLGDAQKLFDCAFVQVSEFIFYLVMKLKKRSEGGHILILHSFYSFSIAI